MFKAPFAQPVVTRDYDAAHPAADTPIPNLYLATCSRCTRQDRGQNYSVQLANKLAAHLQVETPTQEPQLAASR